MNHRPSCVCTCWSLGTSFSSTSLPSASRSATLNWAAMCWIGRPTSAGIRWNNSTAAGVNCRMWKVVSRNSVAMSVLVSRLSRSFVVASNCDTFSSSWLLSVVSSSLSDCSSSFEVSSSSLLDWSSSFIDTASSCEALSSSFEPSSCSMVLLSSSRVSWSSRSTCRTYCSSVEVGLAGSGAGSWISVPP